MQGVVRIALLSGLVAVAVACAALSATLASAAIAAPATVSPVAQTRVAAPPGTLFVVRRGWHIDIGFAVDDLEEPLSNIAAGFPQARYLLFGFGDRHYLTAAPHGASLLRALWPGPGLLLVTGLRATPAAAFGLTQITSLATSREGLRRAQSFVWNTLTEPQQSAMMASRNGGRAVTGAPGPYEGSSFFDSRAQYSALHTCNTWAAEVLQRAGFAIRSRGTVFAGQLWRQLRGATPPIPRPAPGVATISRLAKPPG